MIRVSAGIIRNPQGEILVCRRGEGRKNAHLWEFPGGKQEPGESPADCLRRELLEELSLPVESLQPVYTDEAQGLAFDFLLGTSSGTPVPTEHEAVRWLAPRDLAGLPFCPADTEVARSIFLNAPRPDTFLWDADGTLLDTYPMMTHCLRLALQSFGHDLPENELLDLMKDSLGACLEEMRRRFDTDPEALDRRFRELEAQAPAESVPLVPGIRETLTRLKEQGGRHFLVTHRDRSAWAYLEANGVKGLFDGGVLRENGLPRKPWPDSIFHLIRQHDLEKERCVMIGDRPLDTEAGNSAGILTCLLDTENRFPQTPCSLRVTTAEGLADVLHPKAIL